MKKKRLIFSVFALMTLALLASCGTEETQKKTTNNSQEETMQLSFGAMPAVDSLPVYVAQKEGFFKDEGLDLDLQSFKSPKDRDAALSSGNLNGANTDLIAVSTYLEGDMDFQVVSQSDGDFVILTNDDAIKSVKELTGKSVGYAKNQAPYYVMDMALKQDGLDLSDVLYEEVPQIPVRIELLKNGKIDATVVPEPFATIGKAKGLNEVGNSTDLGINPTVFGFTSDSLKNNPKAIEAFYKAYDKGVDYINEHDIDDYYDVMKEKIGYTDDIKDQVALPKYTHAKQIEDKQLTNALNWSKEQGIYTKDLKEQAILNPLLTNNQ